MQNKQLIIFAIFTILLNASCTTEKKIALNNETAYRYENYIYNINEKSHTAIKPYSLCTDTIDAALNKSYDNLTLNKFFNNDLYFKISKDSAFGNTVNPYIDQIGGYDFASKKALNHSAIGLTLFSNYSNSITFNGDLSFHTQTMPNFVLQKMDSTKLLPHVGKYLNRNGDNVQYLQGSASLTYNTWSHFTFEIGYGKNFWGDGYRSLILSDNAASYPYFKMTINIWNLQYQYLVTALQDAGYWDKTQTLERKYAVMHILSWNITKRINLNIFETVVWHGTDSIGFRGIDVNYLNPFIFFRPVEFSLGSPDNVLLGAGFRVKLFQKTHIYGQMLLDEFVLSEMENNPKWWGNKYALQIGFKSFDFLKFKGFYLQGEANYVRPFTYSHIDNYDNYGDMYDPLAHPLGANFWETIGIIRYSKDRWSVMSKNIFAMYGSDIDSLSVGNNIYKPYTTRNPVYENNSVLLQGLKNKFIYSETKIMYLLNPKWNMYLECGYINRFISNSLGNENFSYIFFGIHTALYNDHWDN